ncbi:hypothetical protein [uncultured Litoreibacter sp.]|uniref:hypothetical protein n=1 Tax=uncultured Litoreibacter sp. TaxID=1392394 RepID=UPI00262BE2C1|nr:hypothetical protein [uncultured Litoreibacter sp.]
MALQIAKTAQPKSCRLFRFVASVAGLPELFPNLGYQSAVALCERVKFVMFHSASMNGFGFYFVKLTTTCIDDRRA